MGSSVSDDFAGTIRDFGLRMAFWKIFNSTNETFLVFDADKPRLTVTQTFLVTNEILMDALFDLARDSENYSIKQRLQVVAVIQRIAVMRCERFLSALIDPT